MTNKETLPEEPTRCLNCNYIIVDSDQELCEGCDLYAPFLPDDYFTKTVLGD